MNLLFLLILVAYALVARWVTQAATRRWPTISPFANLGAFALGIGGLSAMALASMMIAKGGSHVDYCPNPPAGSLLECMPSVTGLLAAFAVSGFVGLLILVVVAPFLFVYLFSKSRRAKKATQS